MKYHEEPLSIINIKTFENQAISCCVLFPDIPQMIISTSFLHPFSWEYSAGYYSYKWSQVYDADAFAYFKESGIFNKRISNKFKNNILSKGGSDDPMKLFKNFRGREPTIYDLLKRSGFI